VLTVQSGGRVIKAGLDIAAEIETACARAALSTGFPSIHSPAEHPDEYHDLNVEVNRPGLNARSDTGFYDQP